MKQDIVKISNCQIVKLSKLKLYDILSKLANSDESEQKREMNRGPQLQQPQRDEGEQQVALTNTNSALNMSSMASLDLCEQWALAWLVSNYSLASFLSGREVNLG